MRKIRRHKDITTRWRVKTNGAATALTGRDLSLFLVDPVGNHSAMDFSITDTNLITFVWYGKEQDMLGAYTLTLVENIRKAGETAVDAVDYVELVATTAQETPATSSDLLEVSAVNLTGDLTTNGRGASAYEVWLAEGNTGTVEDYFDYLKKPATDAATDVEARVAVLETAASAATSAATSAAGSAQSAATSASSAATAANTAANTATSAATSATTAATAANEKATAAATAAEAAGKVNAGIMGDYLSVTNRDGKTTLKYVRGAAGKDGKDGSDASVTAANIQTALGFAPAKASDLTSLDSKIGNLSSLTTTAKTSAVAAINELKSAFDALTIIDEEYV